MTVEATAKPLGRLNLVATIVATLLLAACSSGTQAKSSTPVAKPIKIGISLSRSGDFSDPATQVERGYQLWADHVNAKGGLLGRKVQLVVVDDASSPTQVVTNYQNLISRDKVDLVFGPFSSLLTIPSAQVATRYGYAFLEPEGGGPKVFAAKLRNLFFVQPAPAVSNGEVFAKWVLSLPAAERPKTAAYAQVKAMIQLGFSPKMLFLSNGANAPTEFPDKVGKANTEGILSTGTWSADAKTNGNQQFQAEYVKKYGGSPRDIDGNTVDAYAVGQLLEEVAAKTGSVDNDKIIQTLHSGTWSTIQGELRWDAYGAPQGSDVLLQWIGGTLDPVYPPAVATRQPVVTKAPWSR